jgi:hypothetical protein
MGVDKEELSIRCIKQFKGHFLNSVVTSVSTFKAEFLSNCSLTAVYEITFSSAVCLLSNIKKHHTFFLLPNLKVVGHIYAPKDVVVCSSVSLFRCFYVFFVNV